MAFSWHVHSETQTHDFAAALASHFKAHAKPIFLSLNGTLGMGKTSFARGFIRAFSGHDDLAVVSPSFTILQEYEIANPHQKIRHYDLYRLEEEEELYELDWDEAVHNDICLVEWAQRAGDLHPEGYISLLFEPLPNGKIEGRKITMEMFDSCKELEDEIIRSLENFEKDNE